MDAADGNPGQFAGEIRVRSARLYGAVPERGRSEKLVNNILAAVTATVS